MVSALADEVLAFKSLLPTLSCLLNPVLRIRHWDAIEQCTGHWFGKESETTLGHLQEIQVDLQYIKRSYFSVEKFLSYMFIDF